MNIRNDVRHRNFPFIYGSLEAGHFLRMPITAQDISKGTKTTKKEVNQVIYKMSDVRA